MKLEQGVFDELEDAWLGLTKDDVKNIKFSNPFKIETEDDYGISPLRIFKNPNYISYAGKILLNLDIPPVQACILHQLEQHSFPMLIGSRGLSKSSSMAFYFLLKMALTPPNKIGGAGVQIIITGAGFRQSKQVFEYMAGIYQNSKVLQSISGFEINRAITKETDRYTLRIGPNRTICIPMGDGQKIRGLRGNIVAVDEFSAVSPDIFETVIQGFAAVSSNPVDAVKKRAKAKRAKELGVEIEQQSHAKNQIIISGTCGYDFEHFSSYWKKYKKIIESKGDEKKLLEIFPDGIPERFNWKDYCVIRIPYTKVPDGFLDADILARAKGTIHSGNWLCEYAACFAKDSDGFFKRSLIDSCVASSKHVDNQGWPLWCRDTFSARTVGNPNNKHVMAVDPASERDNFSIVILELWPEHRRIVYCWTTNKKHHQAALKAGITRENDFYAYAARTIRELLRAFPCEKIAIDKQGGGIGVIEALHNKNNLFEGEIPIWPMIDSDKPAETDMEAGLHILEVCPVSNADWVAEANHGLRHDMENKILLFPMFDSIELEIANGVDMAKKLELEKQFPTLDFKLYNTLEDCVFEIEEMKDELTSIVHTKIGTGAHLRDRWDTPEIKKKDGKKGRMRKDRYSSLLMANMIARKMQTTYAVAEAGKMGGYLMSITGKESEMYDFAPDNYKQGIKHFFDEI